jgi:hypothetical protein
MFTRAIIAIWAYVGTSVVVFADSGIFDTYNRSADTSFGTRLFSMLGSQANFGKNYALIVGVGKYNSFSQLDASSSDAIHFRNFLRDEQNFAHIVTMTDEKATR